jgi:hypothetical protein
LDEVEDCSSHYGNKKLSLKEDKIQQVFICSEGGHVETNGPRGSTLIQYYACKTSVEMTPAQRYQELRSKEL